MLSNTLWFDDYHLFIGGKKKTKNRCYLIHFFLYKPVSVPDTPLLGFGCVQKRLGGTGQVSGYFFVPVRCRMCSPLLLNMCVSYVTLRPKVRSGWNLGLSQHKRDKSRSLHQPGISLRLSADTGSCSPRFFIWFCLSAKQLRHSGRWNDLPKAMRARSLGFSTHPALFPSSEGSSVQCFWQQRRLLPLRPPCPLSAAVAGQQRAGLPKLSGNKKNYYCWFFSAKIAPWSAAPHSRHRWVVVHGGRNGAASASSAHLTASSICLCLWGCLSSFLLLKYSRILF